MKKVSIVKAKQILEELVEDVNNSHEPIILKNDQGKDCVLVSLEDWNAIQETL